MFAHPNRTTLEAFLRSRLPATEAKAVLAHLVGGCRSCQEVMAPFTTAMFEPAPQEPPELAPEVSAAYDAAIASAFAKVAVALRSEMAKSEDLEGKVARLLLHGVQGAPLPGQASFWTWPLCETLLERSRALRHDDPARMLELAKLARQAADRLTPEEHGPHDQKNTADLRSRAWAEMANAHRVNDDLPQAEAAMAWAMELHGEGTGSPPLLARLADLSASLFCDQRRFREAFRMLDTAHILYRQQGDQHEAGRVLIMKGLYTGYTGNPEEGLQLLAQGLAAIERERDLRLVFHTLHNILLFRVELGEFEEAQQQIRDMRPLYAQHAGPIEQVKLCGIEGKIATGLGDHVRAEELFRQVRRDLDAAGLGYQAALISLDLAAVCMRLGKKAEVRQLVDEMVATFRAVGVEREAMAAMLMLTDAVAKDQTTLELLALVSGVLQRLQRGPGLLVQPDPD
jgi:tetratricopeptide (TPR) repeat protein